MSFTVVIPARYASSRLPGKPLADIGGKPMIQWVIESLKVKVTNPLTLREFEKAIQSLKNNQSRDPM